MKAWGEILWTQGKKEDAKAVWENSLNRYPSNAVLKETTDRLR